MTSSDQDESSSSDWVQRRLPSILINPNLLSSMQPSELSDCQFPIDTKIQILQKTKLFLPFSFLLLYILHFLFLPFLLTLFYSKTYFPHSLYFFFHEMTNNLFRRNRFNFFKKTQIFGHQFNEQSISNLNIVLGGLTLPCFFYSNISRSLNYFIQYIINTNQMNAKEDDNNPHINLVNPNEETPRNQPNRLNQNHLKQNQQQPQNINQNRDYDLSNAAHPLLCILTFAFKLAAFVSYFIIGHAISDVLTFIIVVSFGAVDFWIVKNVTGRLLVGLRWWNDFDHEGKQVWKYESYDREYTANTVDATFFWTSQISGTIVWAVFCLLNIIGLNIFWTLLVFINFSLCGTNLYGYYKCRKEYSKKLKDLKQKWAREGLVHFADKIF